MILGGRLKNHKSYALAIWKTCSAGTRSPGASACSSPPIVLSDADNKDI